ncbi:MAG: cysteine--tRNA ligase, partial [Methylocapsa sp.]|nr:cysteine--tRNA ligase [Methylocapsa sp.]
MPLRFYNTLTRKKETFAPLDPANVRLYACGPTVYDHLHIGNGRMLIVFDVLYRLLRYIYGESHVTYVRNITDVDDKINARAAERRVDIRVLTDEMTAIFHEDARALGCAEPAVEPRATEHIPDIIALIEKLIAKGHAYVAEGHVLFDVPSMPSYGKLSRRPIDEMIAGARVEVAPYKRSPMDFVLWKPSGAKEPGWDSPWGRGRPGWHIECSAMSWKHLGETFDIHGGGIDLVFPHHENEIAQSCSAFGHEKMANFWIHNGHLQVESEKMSKSLGNFVTIRDLWATEKFGGKKWRTGTLRLAMLMTHYREPIDWSVRRCNEAESIIQGWEEVIDVLEHWDFEGEPSGEVMEALSDDLDTPTAITALHALAKRAHSSIENAKMLAKNLIFLEIVPRVAPMSNEQLAASNRAFFEERKKYRPDQLAAAGHVFLEEVKKYRKHASGMLLSKIAELNLDISKINLLIEQREKARAAKNWGEADRIRDELTAMGIALKDNKD